MITSQMDDVADVNKLHHIFGQSKHNFDEFLRAFNGDQKLAYNKLFKETTKYVNTNGITGQFDKITVNVIGYDITVSGIVIDGIVNIGTAYIP